MPTAHGLQHGALLIAEGVVQRHDDILGHRGVSAKAPATPTPKMRWLEQMWRLSVLQKYAVVAGDMGLHGDAVADL
jgi:hypothetical protein